jgi:flagellar hook assembly protein FlgD
MKNIKEKKFRILFLVAFLLAIMHLLTNAEDKIIINLKGEKKDSLSMDKVAKINFINLSSIDEASKNSMVVYPNPFQEFANINFELKSNADATIRIYNVAGELIRITQFHECNPGTNTFRWDCTDNCGERVRQGTYFIEISAGLEILTKKIIMTN